MARANLICIVAWGQGLLYALTGVWPIVHIASFEAVTGPKTDDWLVKTVGVLVTVIGVVLIVAARRRRFTSEIVLLAAGSALALTAIDLIYALGGVISPIYLLDAVAEMAIAAVWGMGWAARDRA